MRLFHFSDRDDIEVFRPQPPLRHPQSEALVYAIDEWHSPLYLFPRDCPRVGVWPLDKGAPMRLLIDRSFESAWRSGKLLRYELDPADGFVDCRDHGVWTSRQDVTPIAKARVTDLPGALEAGGIVVEVVNSLIQASREFYDPIERRFTTDLHVSMVRMSLLPDWDGEAGKPVTPLNP